MPSVNISKGDKVLYKGVVYRVEFAGKTKFGFRAKLSYLNGTKEFWVNLSDVSPVDSTPTKTQIEDYITDLEESVKAIVKKPKPIPKKTSFDSGPPNPAEKKPVNPNPPPSIYATTQQIEALKALKSLKPELGGEWEKLSYVEADKLIRSTLVSL